MKSEPNISSSMMEEWGVEKTGKRGEKRDGVQGEIKEQTKDQVKEGRRGGKYENKMHEGARIQHGEDE